MGFQGQVRAELLTSAHPTAPQASSVQHAVLRANGVQNISLALYANAVSFDQLLALGAQ